MLTRRSAFASVVPALIGIPARAEGSFQNFVAGVYAEATAAGIRRDVLDAAFAGVTPNQAVIDKDRKQAEFHMTWTRYRALVISDKRIANGRAAVAQNRALFASVEGHFRVAASVIAGIWGLESSFGVDTGNYKVIEALATLAWEGRRASFFRAELMASLKILNNGDITAARMTGSYAGAMGQPQFMPTSYLRLAVDFDGDGRRDIWGSKADVLGSIGNYLNRSDWRPGETWGQPVKVPAWKSSAQAATSKDHWESGRARTSSRRAVVGPPATIRPQPCSRPMARVAEHFWCLTTSRPSGTTTRPIIMPSRSG